jgi:periplasmic protein TonB
MAQIFVALFLLAGTTLAGAQIAPGPNQTTPQPSQPGMPQPQPGTDPTAPNAVPGAPPAFVPGVGSGNDAAPSSRSRVIRISGGVMAGNIVSKVDPVYPDDARAAHISGTVVMAAIIGNDGHVQSLSVVSGPQRLQAPAVAAVKQWVYRPYMLNGQPVTVQTVINVNFDLR